MALALASQPWRLLVYDRTSRWYDTERSRLSPDLFRVAFLVDGKRTHLAIATRLHQNPARTITLLHRLAHLGYIVEVASLERQEEVYEQRFRPRTPGELLFWTLWGLADACCAGLSRLEYAWHLTVVFFFLAALLRRLRVAHHWHRCARQCRAWWTLIRPQVHACLIAQIARLRHVHHVHRLTHR